MRAIVTILACSTIFATAVEAAVPSAVLNIETLKEWDFSHEPAIKGGAKSIEEVTVYGSITAAIKYIITLNEKGQYTHSKQISETDSKIYDTAYRYNADGDLAELTSSCTEKGGPEKVFKRETATYSAKGNLASITCEACQITSDQLRHTDDVTVENAQAKTSVSVRMHGSNYVVRAMCFSFSKPGAPATAMTMPGSGNPVESSIRRDKNGNATGFTATIPQGKVSCTIKYEFDAKGNWTKAVVTDTLTPANGQKITMTKEIRHKITY